MGEEEKDREQKKKKEDQGQWTQKTIHGEMTRGREWRGRVEGDERCDNEREEQKGQVESIRGKQDERRRREVQEEGRRDT